MAYFSLFLLALLVHSSYAQLELPQKEWFRELRHQQQHRLRWKSSCQIQNLEAREPDRRYECEAGYVEYWDSNSKDLECAGIQFVRHVIQPKGLLLPHYANAPQLTYIIQGRGIQGMVIPGCAETYESEEFSRETYRKGEESENDRHQKVRRFRQGDVLAFPVGFTRWTYNDGETPIISVSMIDVANRENQLDWNFRKFYLAGNPPSSRRRGESERRRESGRGEEEWSNIFRGFDEEFLAQAFNVENELIRKLQSQDDNRGCMVNAERLRLVLPEQSREEREWESQHGGEREQEEREWERRRHGREGQQEERKSERRHGGEREQEEREWERRRHGREETGQRGRGNGLEETFCTLKLEQNIDDPSRADFFNPRSGRISTINSQTLPVLSHLRLSAERGILYKNASESPKFSVNAHVANYITRGSARIQVVGPNGNAVFDGEVKQGQLLVIPQNYAVVKRANENGFEWIAFKTNDNAISTNLAGRLSAIRSIPVEVLANAYDVSREDASKLKFNREEATLFASRSGSRRGSQA